MKILDILKTMGPLKMSYISYCDLTINIITGANKKGKVMIKYCYVYVSG